ncbi:MAG: UDP-N-acetylmuramoyl-L-alanine--D-glutamate ligase [Bacteroidales bacterium]|jgi:UDP-N-acetylmuramoylalanine--D-glutamate ligase
MKDRIKDIIKNKKILILGFGREGQSTYKVIRKYFQNLLLTIADLNKGIQESSILKGDKNINFKTGEEYLKNLDEFDLIIKSPGISLNKINEKFPFEKITSQTGIFFNLFSERIIGITGTKGKSTTSSLIYHILKLHNDNVVFAGNIGIPVFDIIDDINEKTLIVCEISSHQLEYIRNAPHISILLNYFQEHLDYYKTYDDYKLAKFNIVLHQNEKDYLIYNSDNHETVEMIKKYNLKRSYVPFSICNALKEGIYVSCNFVIYKNNFTEEKVYDITSFRNIKGEHNLYNMISAIAVGKILGLSNKIINEGLSSFKGLPHRMEYVGNYEGIDFYNDSIATIPEATIEAVKALKKVNTLIIGGFDRGIDYNILIDFLENNYIEHIVFIDETGKRIMVAMKSRNKCNSEMFFVNTMKEAVEISKAKTEKNTICLLSPAAASYGMFKNFEDRGEQFMKLVKN